MSDLVISSSVKLNGTAVAARFTTITLSSGAGRTSKYPNQIQGVPGAYEPLTFQWDAQHLRQTAVASLLPTAAVFVARGPTRTLSGSYDAVVNQGAELCLFTWAERDRSTNTSEPRSVSGYYRISRSGISGAGEQLSVIVYPVDRLRFVGSTDYLEPQ